MPETTLVLYSSLAFYPMHWEAFRHLCAHYRVRGVVLANSPPALPSVHRQLGWVTPEAARAEGWAEVRLMPPGPRLAQAVWLWRQLADLRPGAIWVQEEPIDHFLLAILAYYLLDRRPRIVTAVCENIFGCRPPFGLDALRRRLWARLDGLLAVAQPSVDGIRAVGMPAAVPAQTLVAGVLTPPETVAALVLPFDRQPDDFVVAFAGRFTEQKGWKFLLLALKQLPANFKCILAGDGEQLPLLQAWLVEPDLRGRAFYLGLFPKDELWRFYRAADCLVLPSIDVPYPKEQFGGVLADGMAMGVPVIGSRVGGIPDVIGPAGVVVPDRDPAALADAIQSLAADPERRRQLAAAGQARYAAEFAIPAYAGKIAAALRLEPR